MLNTNDPSGIRNLLDILHGVTPPPPPEKLNHANDQKVSVKITCPYCDREEMTNIEK